MLPRRHVPIATDSTTNGARFSAVSTLFGAASRTGRNGDRHVKIDLRTEDRKAIIRKARQAVHCAAIVEMATDKNRVDVTPDMSRLAALCANFAADAGPIVAAMEGEFRC
jgi:cobalamin-dependent methionine synthase I